MSAFGLPLPPSQCGSPLCKALWRRSILEGRSFLYHRQKEGRRSRFPRGLLDTVALGHYYHYAPVNIVLAKGHVAYNDIRH